MTLTPFSSIDHALMARALRLAERGLATTSPNPRVGCVIARGDEVVGEGWHQRAGGPHAEVFALRAAGSRARGATAYVTLEPCGLHGRTPPCTDALIAAGIARVVIASEDAFQREGTALDRLRAAGVAVETGLLREAARELNRGFFSRIERGRPWLRLKLATSLDGRTALANGESKWITGEAARADVQRWRARSSAILTGIGTVLADDPALTVRALKALPLDGGGLGGGGDRAAGAAMRAQEEAKSGACGASPPSQPFPPQGGRALSNSELLTLEALPLDGGGLGGGGDRAAGAAVHSEGNSEAGAFGASPASQPSPVKGEGVEQVPPLRVVLDRRLRTPRGAQVLDGAAPTLVLHARDTVADDDRFARVELAAVESGAHGLDLHEVLRVLAARGMNEVQVEAGPILCGALFAAGLVDELLLYVAPILLGDSARPLLALPALSDMAGRWKLRIVEQRQVGEDLRLLLRRQPDA